MQSIFLNGTIINNEWYGEACDYTSNLTQGVNFQHWVNFHNRIRIWNIQL